MNAYIYICMTWTYPGIQSKSQSRDGPLGGSHHLLTGRATHHDSSRTVAGCTSRCFTDNGCQ